MVVLVRIAGALIMLLIVVGELLDSAAVVVWGVVALVAWTG